MDAIAGRIAGGRPLRRCRKMLLVLAYRRLRRHRKPESQAPESEEHRTLNLIRLSLVEAEFSGANKKEDEQNTEHFDRP